MVRKLVAAIEPGYHVGPLVPQCGPHVVAACAWSFAVGVMVGFNVAAAFIIR